jgi:arsenate reductase-like glutaredoxin family protein
VNVEYYEDMLEQEAINRYLNMIANDYGGELAKIFQEKYINKDKEIERLNKDNGDITKLFAKEREETKRLHSIIKEVREYIETEGIDYEFFNMSDGTRKTILKILERANNRTI